MSDNKDFITGLARQTKRGFKESEHTKHPLIYLKVPFNSKVYCPYCGRVF